MASQVRDGYTAVGNFDDDAFPEIVLVSRGWVFLLEHDGAVKWGPTFLEPVRTLSYRAGPPTVADVDGDGQLEIAVAGSHYLAVFETDGSVKWRAPDHGQHAQRRHRGVRLRRGRRGRARLRATRSTCGSSGAATASSCSGTLNGTSTVSDSPVVADVDGDGEAEIVSVTDARLDAAVTPGRAGLRGGRRALGRPRAGSGTSSSTA